VLSAGRLAALSMLLFAGCAGDDGGTARLDAAQALFQRFVVLGNTYDEAIGELYANDARITLIREGETAPDQVVTISGVEYKALLPELMPAAREAGAQNSFSALRFSEDDDGLVRIDAQRHAMPQDFTAPHTLRVGPSPQGRWLIREEVAVSPL